MNALWRLAVSQPQLLAAHAAGYVALIREEGALSLALFQRRATLRAVAFSCVAVAAVFAGVATMLWATAPAGNLVMSWVLVVVPAVPLLGAGWALHESRRGGALPLWAAWRKQIAADSALINPHASA
jgi:uncharacterized membrane protein YqjE